MATTLLMGYPGDGAARPTINAYQGDAVTALSFLIKTSAGAAVDLSTYDSAWLSASHDGTWMFDLAAMTIAAGSTGAVSITPSAAQVATAGRYVAVIRFVDGSVVTYSEPFTINVVAPGVHDSTPAVTWTQIQVYGRKGNDPVGEAMIRFSIHVLTNEALIASTRLALVVTPAGISDYVNVIGPAVAYSTPVHMIAFWPRTFTYAGVHYTLNLEHLTMANGEYAESLATGINIDTDLFTAAGEMYYFSPSALNGVLTVVAPPNDDYPGII